MLTALKNPRTLRTQDIILTVSALLVTFFLVIDSISNPHKTEQLIGTPAYELIVPFLLIQAGWHLGWGVRMVKQTEQVITWLLLPAVVLLTTVLTLIDAYSPLNTVFTLTRLHQSRLGALVVFWIGLILLNQTKNWWGQHHQKILIGAPLVAFGVAMWVRLWPWNIFLELVKENHLTENLQFLVLAMTACWTATRAWRHLTNGKYLEAVLAIILTIGLGFIAGDEIAWMQHHLGYATPVSLTNSNQQAETTIHNLASVGQFMEFAYLLLTAFGSLSWVIITATFPKSWKHLRELVPQPRVALYFAVPCVYIFNNFWQGGGQYPAWSEPIELLLYFGLAFWLSQLVTRKISRYLQPRT